MSTATRVPSSPLRRAVVSLNSSSLITLVLSTICLPTAPGMASTLDWRNVQTVVDTALTNSPTLQRLEAEAAAARERTVQAGSLPNPMVMTGVQDKQIDLTSDPMMTMFMVGASQTWTRPSKREARRKTAMLEADGLELLMVSVRAETERDALLAYDDILSMDSQLRTAEEMRALIGTVIDAARVRYEVGTTAQSDVIRAQLERSGIEQQILRLQGARNAARARLLPMLSLPGGTEIPRLALPALSDSHVVDMAEVPLDDHPAIAILQTEISRQEERIRLARLQTRPDITFEGSYSYRGVQTDMFSLVARIELPIRRKTLIAPGIREALSVQDATRMRMEEVRRGLTIDLGLVAASLEEASQQLRLHEAVLVPQSRLAFESALASYQTGTSSFDAVLATAIVMFRLELQRLEFLTRRLKTASEFEALRRGARGAGGGIAGGSSVAGLPSASSRPVSMSGM